mgnify:CR=1 FL=1
MGLSGPVSEICFWSTSSDAEPTGSVLSYNGVTLTRDAENFIVEVGVQQHFVPVNRAVSHTCVLFSVSGNVKVVQDGMEWGWYAGNGVGHTTMTLGGNGFFGTVSELAASAGLQDSMLRNAQSQGSACNLDDGSADTSGADGNLDGTNAWSEWGSCSHNCNGGRSYRYRHGGHGLVQMFRNCNAAPCADGWEDWSQWTPCASSCGAGVSHRTRRCVGSRDACEGEPNEEQPCAGLPCPQCGYSNWQFPANQATTNYLQLKPVIPNMGSVSICFAVNTGSNELHGTVFSYSKGLDSPRGNELLFLGKDITNSEIRLYRRNQKLSIPNDVLVAGTQTHFCIVLQAQPDVSYISD